VFRNVGIKNSEATDHPKERMQHSQHGESLKLRMFKVLLFIESY